MRTTTPRDPSAAVSNPAETEYLDAGITNGMTYYYVIRAMNDGGKGPYSIEVKATPVAPAAAPPRPSAVPGNGSVSLTWSEVAGAKGYALHRAPGPEGPFSVIATSATA